MNASINVFALDGSKFRGWADPKTAPSTVVANPPVRLRTDPEYPGALDAIVAPNLRYLTRSGAGRTAMVATDKEGTTDSPETFIWDAKILVVSTAFDTNTFPLIVPNPEVKIETVFRVVVFIDVRAVRFVVARAFET